MAVAAAPSVVASAARVPFLREAADRAALFFRAIVFGDGPAARGARARFAAAGAFRTAFLPCGRDERAVFRAGFVEAAVRVVFLAVFLVVLVAAERFLTLFAMRCPPAQHYAETGPLAEGAAVTGR
jgi:hypothetical protein